MAEPKQINFSIVPADPESQPRIYSNFCAIAHTPFDMTMTFCEVLPLTEKDLKQAETEHVVRAPVRVNVVIPLAMVPNLIGALQERLRAFSDQPPGNAWGQDPIH